MNDDYAPRAVVRKTGRDPFVGNDLGVYIGENCLRSFNTIADDYAHTHAHAYADEVNANINRNPS